MLDDTIDTLTGRFTKLDDTLRELQTHFGRFVELLAPGTTFGFSLAMRDLGATIGTSLEPAFRTLTDTIKEVSGTIYPLMQRLAPIIAQISNIFGNIMLTSVTLVSDVFGSLAGILGTVVTSFDTVTQIVRVAFTALGAIITTVVDGFTTAINIIGDFSGLFGLLNSELSQFAKTLAYTGASIAMAFSFLGGAAFLDRLISSLSPGTGAVAVPWGPSIMRTGQIANEIAQSAFASGGGPQQTTNDLIREIISIMREVRAGGGTNIPGAFATNAAILPEMFGRNAWWAASLFLRNATLGLWDPHRGVQSGFDSPAPAVPPRDNNGG